MPDMGWMLWFALWWELCVRCTTHTKVVGGGEGEHGSAAVAGSRGGGNWVHSRTGWQVGLESACPTAGWDLSPQGPSLPGKPLARSVVPGCEWLCRRGQPHCTNPGFGNSGNSCALFLTILTILLQNQHSADHTT